MEPQRTKDALLFIIALCLVLIVVKLYSSVDLVSRAEAQPSPSRTNLYGCSLLNSSAPGGCDTWVPLRVDSYDGRLLVTSH
jgi:hypothetical protein